MKATWEEFVQVFQPVENHLDGNASHEGKMFETYGQELEFVRNGGHAAEQIWTMLDVDGRAYLMSGYHHVNRMGYFVTKVPIWPGADIEIPLDDNESQSAVPVAYWDSAAYGNETAGASKAFVMSIDDQRDSNGQMYVDIASEDGDPDNVLSLTLEINRLPESDTDTQCVHLHFNSDQLCCSIFKQGDAYIIRPETDVDIDSCRLPHGERAWVIK